MIVSKQGFADLTGFSSRQVTTWLSQGMPAEDTGGRRGAPRRIDTVKAIGWLMARAGGGTEPDSLQKARQELIKQQAAKEALRVKVLSGELINRSDVTIVVNEGVTALVRGLEQLPGRVAAGNPVLHRRLKVEVRRIRGELADQLAHLASRGKK